MSTIVREPSIISLSSTISCASFDDREQNSMAEINQAFDSCECLNASFKMGTKENEQNKAEKRNLPISIAWRNLNYKVSNTFRPFCVTRKRQTILDSVTGSATAGSLTALMGPSGAGKTTLLNVLSGKIPLDKLSEDSQIYIRGGSGSGNETRNIVTYFIEQHVHRNIEPRLTVAQIFEYAFRFKNGLFVDRRTMNRHIDDTIRHLLLPREILTRRFEKCSGGEQRRIAIGQELMSLKSPQFLFIDEPTTGLDSAAAQEVIRCLDNLCKVTTSNLYSDSAIINESKSTPDDPITIIVSIHSPNHEILSMFDQVYVLAKGGAAIYAGSSNDISEYLYQNLKEKVNESNKQNNHNAADENHNSIIIKSENDKNVKAIEDDDFDEHIVKKHKQQTPIEKLLKIACYGFSNPNCLRLRRQCSHIMEAKLADQYTSDSGGGIPSTRKPFSLYDLYLYTHRACRITFIARYRSLIYVTFLFALLFAFMAALFNSAEMARGRGCYRFAAPDIDQTMMSFDAERSNGTDDEIGKAVNDDYLDANYTKCISSKESLHDDNMVKENVIYFSQSILLIGFIAMCMSTITFSTGMRIFRSEHRNHWYSLGVAYIATSAVALLEISIIAALIATMNYFFTNQHYADYYNVNGFVANRINWTRFAFYLFFIWLFCVYLQSISQLMGVFLVDHVEVAIIVCQVFYSATCCFNGFYVRLERAGSVVILLISEWFALVDITRGIIYTIYGYERCDVKRNEYSWVLLDHRVDSEHVWSTHAFKVLCNIIAFRAVTFVVMYLRFGAWRNCCWFSFIFRRRRRQLLSPPQSSSTTMPNVDKLSQTSSLISIPRKSAHKQPDELRFEQFTRGKIIFAWKNLTVTPTSSIFEMGARVPQRKPILNSLNGQLRFGTLNALMGTSGAGKTTLLRIINGQCATRLSNSSQFYHSRFSRIDTCFITQEVDHHLMSGLTARQLLLYAYRLKNVGNKKGIENKPMTNRECDLRVNTILEDLNLCDAAETRVERCSGGERKRLALGAELTAERMPNLICIDEPTSGLDSNSSEIVISCLSRLARAHHLTIVASIHQPNSSILYTFDHLIILARGGVCIYAGHPSGIDAHLTNVEIDNKRKTDLTQQMLAENESQKFDCYALENLIKYSCSGIDDSTTHRLVMLTNAKTTSAKVNAEIASQTLPIFDPIQRNRPRFSLDSIFILSARFFTCFTAHLWIEYLFTIINYLLYGYSITQIYDRRMINISGCIDLEDDYNNTCTRTAQQVEDEFSLTDNSRYNYFCTNLFLFIVMVSSSLSFVRQFRVFANENRNGWYSTGAFYLTKSVFDFLLLIPTLFAYVYVIDIYEPAVPFTMYWPLLGVLIIGSIAIEGVAHCFALLSGGNYTVLTITATVIFIFTTMLANFHIPIIKMHYVFQFLANFSIPRFVAEALTILFYGFGRCPPKQFQAILYSMSLADEDFRYCIFMLVGNAVLFRVAAIWLLIRSVNPIENRRRRVARIERYRENLKTNYTEALDRLRVYVHKY